MKLRTLSASTAIALSLLGSGALAHAQENAATAEAASALYMNGGIGKDEQDYMRSTAKDFNVRMEFSEGQRNEFVADVNLAIADTRGNTLLQLSDAGPLTNLRLPEGQYRVSASVDGQTETKAVTVSGKNGKNLYFHWNAMR
jgi:hypothetical protein